MIINNDNFLRCLYSERPRGLVKLLTHMEDKKMRKMTRKERTMLGKLESVMGVFITSESMINKYLSIIDDVINNGFSITDIEYIIENIYAFSYYLNVDIVDIDISSETTIDNKCILFGAFVTIRKNNKDAEIYIRLNYSNNEIHFSQSSFSDCETNQSYYLLCPERLKEVIKKWTTAQKD